MTSSKGKQIDYLVEDKMIPNQRFALISVVGPNMKQKCDVLGLKVRGFAETLDGAKTLTKRIYKADKDYDIYIVEVGKFVPLNINPLDVQDVEYENEQLNSLVKNYLENRQAANEHWLERKNALVNEAIREGQKEGQKELAEKKQHPIAVLQLKKTHEENVKELREKLQTAEVELQNIIEKFESYTPEEKEFANLELYKAALNSIEEVSVQKEIALEIEDIRNEIMNEKTEVEKLEEVLNKLKICENQMQYETDKKDEEKLDKLNHEKNDLKMQLNSFDTKLVNDFINNKTQTSNYDSLF